MYAGYVSWGLSLFSVKLKKMAILANVKLQVNVYVQLVIC